MEGQNTKVRHHDLDEIGRDGAYNQGKKSGWLGQIQHMEDDRTQQQALYWQMHHHIKGKPRRPRKELD